MDTLDQFINNYSLKKIKPHKMLLLLSILELMNEEPDHSNCFTFLELEPIFISLFNEYFPAAPSYAKMLEYPFYHLCNDGFWYLKTKSGKEAAFEDYQEKRLTKLRLLETVQFGYLDVCLYNYLFAKVNRIELKNLITKSLALDVSYEAVESGDQLVIEQESLFEHERSAIKAIRSQITAKNIGMILSNIILNDKQSNLYLEYDLVVITRCGIYVVELKHWSGHIKLDSYNWIVNETHYRNDPHKANSFKCKVLKGNYLHHFKTYPPIWVESIVVFTNPDSTIEGAVIPKAALENKQANITFASINDLLLYLGKKEAVSKTVLSNQQIEAVYAYFGSLNQPKKSIQYTVDGYETVEYIKQTPEYIELIGRSVYGQAKGLNRFRIFRIPHNISGEEKERFIKIANNTVTAVSQIGDHPNINKVFVYKNAEGDIVEQSDWSETGTLKDYMQGKKESINIDEVRNICSAIAAVLVEAHSVNVIHRAVKPENILMKNAIPKLMNFDLSYQLEENHITVIEDTSKLKDDGYTAPELLLGDDIDEGTDIFSLGIIFYELLTRCKPINGVREYVTSQGELSLQATEKLEDAGVPSKIVNLIQSMTIADNTRRLKSAEQVIEVCKITAEQNMKITTEVNAILAPGSRDNVYEIIELKAKGADSQIYLAWHGPKNKVILKLFNKEVNRERVFHEAEIASAINSTYVVHCGHRFGYWAEDRYFIVYDYIEGELMREWINKGNRPSIQQFQTISMCLMEAVAAFHNHKDEEGNCFPYLHSDIKPDNIIIADDKKAVLIDCGIAGEPRTDSFQGTVGYIAPDCLRGTDMQFSKSGDLFALGVSLWEWLLGDKPYVNPAIGDTPTWLDSYESQFSKELKKWLFKAINTEAEKRFATIEEMQNELVSCFSIPLEETIETADIESNIKVDSAETDIFIYPTTENVVELSTITGNVIGIEQDLEAAYQTEEALNKMSNPFVAYLNTLSNASAGNENATAEAQLSNDSFKKIKVYNPIEEYLLEQVKGGQNIILTGNAGDGKTTMAFEVLHSLSGRSYPLLSRIDVPEHNLVLIKDMSELEKTAQHDVLEEALHSDENTYLIVSNTGTLINSFKALASRFDIINNSEILKALGANQPTRILSDRFLLVNIGRINSIGTALDVFRKMCDEENWCVCSDCVCFENCPIYQNVLFVRAKLGLVCDRTALLYRRLYEYGSRLTMRQMVGHLSYALTAGLNCKTVAAMSITALEDHKYRTLFFNNFFGDDGNKVSAEAMQLLPIRLIQDAEFGIKLDPRFERKAWMNAELEKIIGDFPSGNEIAKLLLTITGPVSRKQLRRLAYFFGSMSDSLEADYLDLFLKSPMLKVFVEYTTKNKIPPIKEGQLRKNVLHVLQEYFAGTRLPEERFILDELFITLNCRSSNRGTQMILAEYKAADFELIVKPTYQMGNESSGLLCLHSLSASIDLYLDLPFLDYVAQRYEGEIAEELSAYYTDRLERFKVGLLDSYQQPSNKILRFLKIGSDRKFSVMKVVIDDDGLEVPL